MWWVIRRGLETRFLTENKSTSVNKYAVMLKKPHNSVSHAYVGVRDCKNKWWLAAWVYQSPVGHYHLFVFPGLRVINPSCSFPSCENVKGETPPPVTSPSSRQAPVGLSGAGGAARVPAAPWGAPGRAPAWGAPGSGPGSPQGRLPPGLAVLCKASKGRPGRGTMGRKGTLCCLGAGAGPISMLWQGSAGGSFA